MAAKAFAHHRNVAVGADGRIESGQPRRLPGFAQAGLRKFNRRAAPERASDEAAELRVVKRFPPIGG